MVDESEGWLTLGGTYCCCSTATLSFAGASYESTMDSSYGNFSARGRMRSVGVSISFGRWCSRDGLITCISESKSSLGLDVDEA